MFLNNYHYILLNCTLALLYQCILHYLFENYLFGYAASKWRTIFKYYFLSILFAPAPAPALLLMAIFHLTSIYASL